MTTPSVCPHGQLARSCEICEREARLVVPSHAELVAKYAEDFHLDLRDGFTNLFAIACAYQDRCSALRTSLAEVSADRDRLREALELIEMETRDGGQWGLRDVNEYVAIAREGDKA